MYMQTIAASSPSYDFRRDFDPIARPGLVRYLKHFGYGVDLDEGDDPNDFDLRYYTEAKRYSWRLWKALKEAQEFCELGLAAPSNPKITTWSRENAVALANARLEEMLGASEDTSPVDIDRAAHLGTEQAQKRGLDTGPEAIAYATARFRSKIERNACGNPVNEMYSGFLSYRFQKEMHGEGNVVYLDVYKHQQAKRAAPREEAPEPKQVKFECMFQRVGLLASQPREYLVKGFIPRNEVCNPFGRPDSFKGVAAAQLAVHIAGGVDFLSLAVKQAPTAYFAGERGEQVKRRIKGHARRLGLPSDLPCYFGGKPIDLLSKPDLAFLIANIEAIESDAGRPLGFLVIDTQSRTMGGDENSTKDGAAYAKAIEAIRQATGATLWIIAHTGHSEDAQDRPRGSSALLGAYDTFYRHKKIDEHSGEIKITIDRDGLGGKVIPFAVELYDTGAVNEDGEPVVVPYLEAAVSTAKFTFKKGDEPKQPTPGETLMLKALRAAIRKSVREVAAEDAYDDLLEGAKYVTAVEWHAEFRMLYKTGSTRQAESQAFAKGRSGLIAKGFVGNRGQCYWPTVTAPS